MAKFVPHAASKTWQHKNHLGDTDFKGMERAWRTSEVWQCGKLGFFFEESPREALGEGAQLQWRPQCFGDVTTRGQLPRAEAAVERSWPVTRRKLYCYGWQR